MQEERFIVEVSLLVLIALMLLELYITYYNQSISVRFIHILAPLLLFPFILIMLKHRSFASIILLIVCILESLILLPDMLVNGILGYDKFYAISLRIFLLGLSAIAMGMIMIYRIEWLYVKNRPKDDTMRILDHNMARGGLLYRLLNDKERMLLPMYRYVVVRIYGNDYLVPIQESVPMDSVVVRSNDKMFIGVRKAL